MKLYEFKVWHEGKHIDSVFYNETFFKGFKTVKEMKENIKRSLVEYDGYSFNIIIIL